jgi:hypothetical protein
VLAKWGACLTGEVLAKPGPLPRVLQCASRVGPRLSMATRHEITKKYASEYARASKRHKGRMLDELVVAMAINARVSGIPARRWVIGHRSPIAGRWSLVAGRWSLVAGRECQSSRAS